MFERASRLKLRFFHKGVCSVEDLWDIPLQSLDTLFKQLNTQSKEQKEESLLATKSLVDEVIDLKTEIIKHVVKVRLLEQKAQQDNALAAARKQKLLGIVAEKQDDELRGMSIDDLNKLIDEI